MTSASMDLCSNLDNIVSDYTHWNLDFDEPPYNEVLGLTNDLLRPTD